MERTKFSKELGVFIASPGIKKSDFANKIGISRSVLSNSLKGDREPSKLLLAKLKIHFPDVLNDLLTGEGPMLRGDFEGQAKTAGSATTDRLAFSFKDQPLAIVYQILTLTR